MTDSRNIGQYSRFHSNPAGSGLVDGVDFPHSGLLKALSVGLQNSYAILNGTTADATKNFSIVQTNSSGNTQFVVRAGKVIRDGKLMPEITTATFIQGTPSTFDEPTNGNSYFVLVVTSDSTNVLAIRGDKADTNVVPQLTAGDIPVAIIKLDKGGTVDERSIQYLTTAKSENSISIGYDAGSTTYTEASAITGTSEGLFISGIGSATVESTDKVLIQDTNATGVNNVIKSVTAQSIADLAPQGDITGITAGTGLTGTDLTGPVPTLNVGGLTVSELAASSVIVAGETFADNDTNLMTAAAINDRIESFNYTTNVGDITSVVAGSALTGGGTTGDVTLNVGVDDSTIEINSDALRLKDSGVTVGKMAANSVDSDQYVDGSVDDIHLAAGINANKIADGSVTNEEFQRINTLTSNAQTQLDAKLEKGLFSMWIPAEAISPQSVNPCGSLTTTANGSANQPDFRTLAFDAGTDEFAQFSIAMPKMWDGNAVEFAFYWTHLGSASGEVVWTIAGTSVSDDEGIGVVTFGSLLGNTVTYQDAALTAKDLHIVGSDTALVISGSPAVGDVCFFQISRDANNGNDSFASDALLMGVKMKYTVDGVNDG